MKPSPIAHQSTPRLPATFLLADVPLARLQELDDRDLPVLRRPRASRTPNAAVDLPLPSPVLHEHDRRCARAPLGELRARLRRFRCVMASSPDLATPYARSRASCRRRCVIAVASVLGAGCAQSGYDPSSSQRQLVDAGLRPTQAQCVTDGMQNDASTSTQLGAHSEPTQEASERDAALRSSTGCGVTSPSA